MKAKRSEKEIKDNSANDILFEPDVEVGDSSSSTDTWMISSVVS